MPSSVLLAATLATAAAAAPLEELPTFRYRGLCEASAVVALGPNRFAVASDESRLIRIYERGKPDPIGATVDMGEAEDFEGAAKVGNSLLWVTSHSLTKKGKDQAKRKQLIETSIAGGTLTVGRRFEDLRARITELLNAAEWPLKAVLNIEGMAATPEGDLLFGLRAPLYDEKAAIARIPNPLASPGAAAAAPRLWWLDLESRGIRSLEYIGTGAHAYLIVAGRTGEGDPDGALFWWDGESNQVTPGPDVALKDRLVAAKGLISRDVVPEAAILWGDGTIAIFGDNDANCEDDKPGAWFPSVEIPRAANP